MIPIKKCNHCETSWLTPQDVIVDPTLTLKGFQPAMHNANDSLIYLTHDIRGCNTVMAIRAEAFRSLYDGEIPDINRRVKHSCTGGCTKLTEFINCTRPCDFYWVRFVLKCINTHTLPFHLQEVPPLHPYAPIPYTIKRHRPE